MNKFWAFLDYIQDKMKIISAICLAGMVLLTCIDVVGRLLNHPIFGAEEIVAILSTFVIALSLPYAHKEKCHIGVEILMRLFSLRTQAVVKFSTDILAFILFLIVTWRMTDYAHTMQKVGEVSMNLEFPTYYVIYLLSFCFFVFSLFILQDIFKFFKK
jgi:TRAP-type C4-dicarboxylate transport system permease small subunit